MSRPFLSVVVVVQDMRREVLRTLHTLKPSYQGVARNLFEVIVVDNGSQSSVGQKDVQNVDSNFRYFELPFENSSLAFALNHGVSLSRGSALVLMADCSCMLSPGVIRYALQGLQANARPVISMPGCRLGAEPHQKSVDKGCDASQLDILLDSVDWRRNGYRLFGISYLAEAAQYGVFSPFTESKALVIPRQIFDELGGFDESFAAPGGGLVNHDFYQRALALPNVQLVTLLGEATFQQFHGGMSIGVESSWHESCEEYQRIRGKTFEPYPKPWPRSDYLGKVPRSFFSLLKQSLRLRRRLYTQVKGNPHRRAPGPSIQHETSRTVVILGMHRSGTSLLTGTLQEAGLVLGDVVNSAPHNRKGNRESIPIQILHEDLLERAGGSWDKPPAAVQWSRVHHALRDQIIGQFQGHSVWGFKDPRTLFCLEGWLEAIPELQLVAIVRHPESVARSLQARNGFPLEQGLELWLQYNRRLQWWLDQRDVPLVHFFDDLDGFRLQATALIRQLDLPLKRSASDLKFADAALQHQAPHGLVLPSAVRDLYEDLSSRTVSPALTPPKTPKSPGL